MKKRIIVLLLIAVLAASFAGCDTSVKTLDRDAELLARGLTEQTDYNRPDIKTVIGNEENLFDVKAYGAVGDGSADDTAAVKSATEAAAAVSGILYFSDGKYSVCSFTVPANVVFAVANSAVVKAAKDAIVKIDSTDVRIPKKAVLGGDGGYDLTGGVNYAYSEWFGGGDIGIQGAINAADLVYLSKATYGISETITVPQSRNIEIRGTSNFATILNCDIYGKDDNSAFIYKYVSGAPSTVSFRFMKIQDNSGLLTFVKYEGNPENPVGSVGFEAVMIYSAPFLSDVTYATGCSYREIYAPAAGYLAKLGAGVNDTLFAKNLASGANGGIVVADGLNPDGSLCHGLTFSHTSSVTGKDIDFDIKNYTDVNFIDSSGDLSVGAANEASVKMENVSDFNITRCWWASNAGLSFSPSLAYAQVRVGIYLINCDDGVIRGCSIVNQNEGVKIENSKGEKGILVEGNTFQGNGLSEITLDGAKNVTVQGNFFNSTSQWSSINASYRAKGGNMNLYVKSACENIEVHYNVWQQIIRNSDAVGLKTKGITISENFQGTDKV